MAEPRNAALDQSWTPHSVWADIAPPAHIGLAGRNGVVASYLNEIGLASLIAPAGGSAALAEAFKAKYQLELPNSPKIIGQGDVRAVWAGPDQWLLMTHTAAQILGLQQALSDLGSLSDQSDSRIMVRISGRDMREALAKGCMIDLHETAFPVGSAALTSIAHMGVHLWRLEDGPDGAVFEIAVARSMAASFWSWFSASVAEFGCSVAAH